MSSVHSNSFDIPPLLQPIKMGAQNTIGSNVATIIPSLSTSLRDKISQLGVQLDSVKTAVRECNTGKTNPFHHYQHISRLKANLEEKVNAFCDQIGDLAQSTIHHSKQLDTLLSRNEQVNYNEEIRLLEKINEDLQVFSKLNAPSVEINNALLNINAQFKMAYIITLRAQLIIFNHPSQTNKVPFYERLQECFELKNAIDHVIEQTQKGIAEVNKVQDFSESSLLNGALDENLILAKDINDKLSPLLNTLKSAIPNKPHHAIAASAAEKGKAARGNETILDHLATRQPLKGKADSAQDVYLVNETTVFKNKMGASNQIAEAEEQMIRSLASFKCKSGVVEAYQVNQPGVKLKYDFNQLNKQKRYFEPFNLTSKRVEYFLANKPGLEQPRMAAEEDRDFLKDLATIRKWKDKNFVALKNDDTRTDISFTGLAKYLADRGEEGMDIKEVYPENSDVNIAEDDAFGQALHTFNQLDRLPRVIAPKFNDDTEERAYVECEKCGWYNASLLEETINQVKQKNLELNVSESEEKIRQQAIRKLEIPFSTLMELYIDGKSILDYRTILPLEGSHLALALECDWEFADLSLRKEIMTKNPNTGQIDTMYENVEFTQVKPFLRDMVIYAQLEQRPTALSEVFKRITPDAQYNAIFLSGECQLLDLHSNNLGLSPVSNPSYEKWKDQKFNYPVITSQSEGGIGASMPSLVHKSNISFKEFMLDYLDKKILSTTPITYNQAGEIAFLDDGDSQEIKEIKEALQSDWQFNFFDLDRCLAESNEMLSIDTGYIPPFVSIFLYNSWKDAPLDTRVIERLKNDRFTGNVKMKAWLEKTDSPLLSTLNNFQEWRNYAPNFNAMLSNYSMKSQMTLLDDKEVSVETVKNGFAEHLANLNNSDSIANIKEGESFWKSIETMISTELEIKRSTVKTLKEMSWKELAEAYHTDEEQLKNLNPNLSSDLIVQKGTNIKRPSERKSFDLTSDSAEAYNDRLKIAKQLFPRLTPAQIKALTDRQEAQYSYLSNYEKMKNCAPEDLKTEMMSFIQHPTSPLSSLDRESLGQYLNVCTNEMLPTLKNNLLSKYQPTYFNMMKAMYPLTADLEQIGSIAYGEKRAMAAFNPAQRIAETMAEAKKNAKPEQKPFVKQFLKHLRAIINQGTFGDYNY